MTRPKRLLLTGEIGVGKTRLCRRIADLGDHDGLAVHGLISPAVFEGREKVGIRAVSLRDKSIRPLAHLRGGDHEGISTGKWSFMSDTIRWGNRVLEKAVPCDLLIIDELGVLELERGEGWTQALSILDEGNFKAAVVTIRPSLLESAYQRWPSAVGVKVSSDEEIPHLAGKIYHRFQFG